MQKHKIEWFIISTGVASIHKNPDFDSSCLTNAVYGESCQYLEKKIDWCKVKCEDGYEGWVHSFFGFPSYKKNKPTHIVVFPDRNKKFHSLFPFGAQIKKNIVGSVKINDTLGIEKIIPIAENLIGIPYRWGGKTSFGFDCSGLVQSVLKVCGINIPRDSKEQKQYFQKDLIPMNESKPGDLHFFGHKGVVNHVGFSTGGSGLLHAQGFVKIESLDSKNDKANKNLIDIYLSSHSIKRKFRE